MQDQVLAGLSIEEKKQSKKKRVQNEGPSRQKFSWWYFIKTQDKANEVCQKMFLGTFGITKEGKNNKRKSERQQDCNQVQMVGVNMGNNSLFLKKSFELKITLQFPAYRPHYSRTIKQEIFLTQIFLFQKYVIYMYVSG